MQPARSPQPSAARKNHCLPGLRSRGCWQDNPRDNGFMKGGQTRTGVGPSVCKPGLIERLRLGKGDDDRIQGEDPVLFIVTVEVMSLYAFRGFLEGNNRFRRGHLSEGIGPFVETITGHHNLAVSDRGASRTVDSQAVRRRSEEHTSELQSPLNLVC